MNTISITLQNLYSDVDLSSHHFTVFRSPAGFPGLFSLFSKGSQFHSYPGKDSVQRSGLISQSVLQRPSSGSFLESLCMVTEPLCLHTKATSYQLLSLYQIYRHGWGFSTANYKGGTTKKTLGLSLQADVDCV